MPGPVVSGAEPAAAAAYRAALEAAAAGARWPVLEVVGETGSTNADLRRSAADGAAPGQVLVAGRQNAGRGRRGRVWASPAGGLWISVLDRVAERSAPLAGLAAAVAAAEAVEDAGGPPVLVKWPNDLLLAGGKLGGVLVERWPAPPPRPDTVIGLGMNVNCCPADLPATTDPPPASLQARTGRAWSLPALAAAWLARLAGALAEAPAALTARAARRLAWRGETVRLETESGAEEGVLDGLEPDGGLRLRGADGSTSTHRSAQALRRVLLLVVAAGLALLAAAPARADILHLTNGAVFEGRVFATPEGYRVVTENGTVTIAREKVARHEKAPLPAEAYVRRAAATDPADADANYALALWCRQHDLEEEAAEHFTRVFAVAPDHAAARRAAGYVRDGEAWISREEHLRRQGYLPVGGRWLPAAEARKIRARAERRARIRRTRAAVAALLRRVRRTDDPAELRARAEELADLGPPAVTSLTQNATDHDEAVRGVCYAALGKIDDPEAVETLVRRLRCEGTRRLVRGLGRVLAGHPRREEVRRLLLEELLETPSERARRRLAYGLLALADPAAVEALIRRAEYCPNADPDAPAARQEDAAGETAAAAEAASGVQVIGGQLLERDVGLQELAAGKNETLAEQFGYDKLSGAPYYPAAEALAVVTGRDLGPDRQAWTAWWTEHREAFVFPEPALPERPPRRAPAPPSLGGVSLRETLLRRDGR